MTRYVAMAALLAVGITGCNPERVKYTHALKQEMADMKIKRISNADMVTTIDDMGEKVSAVVQKELTAQLEATEDPARRAELCQLENLPRTRAIAEKYGLNIRLLGAADVKNPALSAKEREILDAYLYNAEQKLPQISNIQKINDTLFIYNAAVPADNLICKVCYGAQPIPFAVWRLAFSKREVIRRMNATAKKRPSAPSGE